MQPNRAKERKRKKHNFVKKKRNSNGRKPKNAKAAQNEAKRQQRPTKIAHGGNERPKKESRRAKEQKIKPKKVRIQMRKNHKQNRKSSLPCGAESECEAACSLLYGGSSEKRGRAITETQNREKKHENVTADVVGTREQQMSKKPKLYLQSLTNWEISPKRLTKILANVGGPLSGRLSISDECAHVLIKISELLWRKVLATRQYSKIQTIARTRCISLNKTLQIDLLSYVLDSLGDDHISCLCQ